MNLRDVTNRVTIFKNFTDLFTGHIELISIILIEATSQGAEGALGGEGERSSCRLELLPDW